MYKYKIVDISNWKTEFITLKGTKEKEQLIIPSIEKTECRDKAFFKEPAENSGDTWSEKLATEIGKAIDFKVHDVDIAIKNNIYGSLVYYSLDEKTEELKEGADLITEEEFDKEKRTEYNFQLIEKTLNHFDKTLIYSFLEIIIFDILIGNTDRHSQNWGLIFDRKTGNVLRVAHAYDNSSSLGREFHSNHKKIETRLKDHDDLIYLTSKGFNLNSLNYSEDDFGLYHDAFIKSIKEKYPKEAKSIYKKSKINYNSFINYNHKTNGSYMIGWENNYKIPPFEFLKLIYTKYPKQIKALILKIAILNDTKINEIVNAIPDCIMHDLNKNFVKKLLSYRRDIMLGFIEINEEKNNEI